MIANEVKQSGVSCPDRSEGSPVRKNSHDIPLFIAALLRPPPLAGQPFQLRQCRGAQPPDPSPAMYRSPSVAQTDAALAERTYATYGGIYIVSSLGWMAAVERALPQVRTTFFAWLGLG